MLLSKGLHKVNMFSGFEAAETPPPVRSGMHRISFSRRDSCPGDGIENAPGALLAPYA